jgi:hypothetical protein
MGFFSPLSYFGSYLRVEKSNPAAHLSVALRPAPGPPINAFLPPGSSLPRPHRWDVNPLPCAPVAAAHLSSSSTGHSSTSKRRALDWPPPSRAPLWWATPPWDASIELPTLPCRPSRRPRATSPVDEVGIQPGIAAPFVALTHSPAFAVGCQPRQKPRVSIRPGRASAWLTVGRKTPPASRPLHHGPRAVAYCMGRA